MPRKSVKLFIAIGVACLGSAQAQSHKVESYIDFDLSLRGWFEKNGEKEAVTSNPTVSGSVEYTWRRKGKSSHLRQHIKLSRSISTVDVDGLSSSGIEYGQSLDGRKFDTDWSIGYLDVPGRKFASVVLNSSISKQFSLGPKNLSLVLEGQSIAFHNMNGFSRDRGSNLILQVEADLKYNPRIRPKLGPFDRFEASLGADWSHLIIGNHPKVTSNLTASIGLTGKFRNGTKIGISLTGQNGIPAPTFPTRSRIGCRLDLSWRVKG